MKLFLFLLLTLASFSVVVEGSMPMPTPKKCRPKSFTLPGPVSTSPNTTPRTYATGLVRPTNPTSATGLVLPTGATYATGLVKPTDRTYATGLVLPTTKTKRCKAKTSKSKTKTKKCKPKTKTASPGTPTVPTATPSAVPWAGRRFRFRGSELLAFLVNGTLPSSSGKCSSPSNNDKSSSLNADEGGIRAQLARKNGVDRTNRVTGVGLIVVAFSVIVSLFWLV